MMAATSAERGEETRARLYEAAVRLIVKEGWGAVTTRKVAAQAGLRPGLVHYHFSTVTDLLVDASLRAVRREVEQLLEMLAGASQGPEGVGQVMAGLAAYSVDQDAAVLSTEMILAATRNERLRAGLTDLLGRWRSAVAGWLAANGNTQDSDGTALLMGAAIDGLLLHRMIDPRLAEVRLEGPLQRLLGLPLGPAPSDPEGSGRPASGPAPG
ncbi:TetR/AcrR family transcriptional regulator [Streptomyces sp. CG1]|uniref:TetR/AcrR family transcriptional regulator n=1 Tax=Streptomyces sp. CG1 TaxID=1287523 RepID=UPI0034E1C138